MNVLWMISLAQVPRTGLRCAGVQEEEEELTCRVLVFRLAVVILFFCVLFEFEWAVRCFVFVFVRRKRRLGKGVWEARGGAGEERGATMMMMMIRRCSMFG